MEPGCISEPPGITETSLIIFPVSAVMSLCVMLPWDSPQWIPLAQARGAVGMFSRSPKMCCYILLDQEDLVVLDKNK